MSKDRKNMKDNKELFERISVDKKLIKALAWKNDETDEPRFLIVDVNNKKYSWCKGEDLPPSKNLPKGYVGLILNPGDYENLKYYTDTLKKLVETEQIGGSEYPVVYLG